MQACNDYTVKGLPSNHQSGFSLLEITVVIVIIAVLVGFLATLGRTVLLSQEVRTTQRVMSSIETALSGFVRQNGRLPCPADITLKPTHQDYGYESFEAGDTSGECSGESGINAHPLLDDNAVSLTPIAASFGAVPANTLGLPDNVMRDRWDNLFVYYVTNKATLEGALLNNPLDPNSIPLFVSSTGLIRIEDGYGSARTNHAIYALWSGGANGHGAVSKTGKRINGRAIDVNQLENCDCDSDAKPPYPNGTQDAILVKRYKDNNSDDIIMFKERHHINGL